MLGSYRWDINSTSPDAKIEMLTNKHVASSPQKGINQSSQENKTGIESGPYSRTCCVKSGLNSKLISWPALQA